MEQVFKTPLTEALNITHPIVLAGMNVASGPKLAAAVTNAGGLGVIGGLGYSPIMLQKQIDLIKQDTSGPFGVDLLLPQVGGGARKTNYDYTDGNLLELIDVICKSGAKLFVSAIGVPSREVVDKLHAAGILVMNMIGAPKHVAKALEAGVDLICAQGTEGGGHTGAVATTVLVPKVVELCKGHVSPLTGKPVMVLAAGGIYNGRGLAAALSWGAAGVWVGTRFVASVEAAAPARHKKAVVDAGPEDTVRTLVYSGRPMRVLSNEYVVGWEKRPTEAQALLDQGVIPVKHDIAEYTARGEQTKLMKYYPLLMGQAAGVIDDVLPARQIVDEMVLEARDALMAASAMVVPAHAKL